jgi:hypothetical protein
LAPVHRHLAGGRWDGMKSRAAGTYRRSEGVPVSD